MVPSTDNFDPLDFVHYGYALVSVDVRGSGASYGLKTLTLPDIREVMDSKQIVQWIAEQSWSDGKVGPQASVTLAIPPCTSSLIRIRI